MSEAADLTLSTETMQEIARDLRLLRLQVDNVAGRLSGHDARFAGIDGRLAAMEQSIHELVGEISRGFGLQQQQITRLEKRIEGVDTGLTALRAAMAEDTARIIAAIGDKP